MTDRSSGVLVLLVLLLLLPSPGAWSQESEAAPGDEAPATLFSQSIGDVGVAVEAQGTWTTRAAGGWGSGYGADGALPSFTYPGYEREAVFEQIPDFSLSLTLLERWYLKAVYGGTWEDRSFEVGYRGQGTEAIQWVRGGNAAFDVPARAGDAPGPGTAGAPAAGAAFRWGPVATEALVRYEAGQRETLAFRGGRDAAAPPVALDAYVRGRFFRVPSGGAALELLAADAEGPLSGPGGPYRVMAAGEASVDRTEGTIDLAAPAAQKVLVRWTGFNPGALSSSALLGLVPETLTVDGRTWAVLIQPGTASPFERRDRYPLAAGTEGRVALWDLDADTEVAGWSVSRSAAADWFQVSGDEEAPFFTVQPGIYPGTEPPPRAAVLPWAFRTPGTPFSGQVTLGTDVVPGTITVVRNGLVTTAWSFDSSSGILKVTGPVYRSDDYEISFRRQDPGAEAADLRLWLGGRWDAAPGQSLEWNFQGRGTRSADQETTAELQRPGQVSAALAWQGSAGPWTWEASLVAGALMADSTGRRRLYGHTDGGTEAALSSDSLRPSAAPGTLGSYSLTEANRAPLAFSDYWTTDPVTGEAQLKAWGTPGVSAEVSGWTGPYLVRGDGIRSDRLAVLETTFDGSTSNQWAGLQVFYDRGRPRDLRSATTVKVALRVPTSGGLAGVQVFLQLGTLAENFDGTGSLRKVVYRKWPALEFRDNARAGALELFALPGGSAWGNDGSGDGWAGDDGTLVSLPLDLDNTSTDWQTVTLALTAAQSQALVRTTGWRLVAVAPGTGNLGARTLLVGPVVLPGTSWSVTDPGTGQVNPREASDPGDAGSRILAASWTGTSSWTIEGRHSPARPASYEALEFRYRLTAGGASAPVTLALRDPEGRGLTASWTAAESTSWTEAKIDLRTGVLTLDGTAAPGAAVTLGPSDASWDRALWSLDAGGPSTGTLEVGRMDLTGSVWEPLASTKVRAAWTQAGAWPSTASPWVQGTNLTLTSASQGTGENDLTWRGQAEGSTQVGPWKVSGELRSTLDPSGQETNGAYESVLGLGSPEGPRAAWTDKFDGAGERAEALSLGWGSWTLGATASASGPPETLDQAWAADTAWAAGAWKASARASWDQTASSAPDLGTWGQSWQDSWSWLVPRDTVLWRSLETRTAATLKPQPWGLDSAAGLTTQRSGSGAGLWTVKGQGSLALPWVGNTGLSLKPRASRQTTAILAPGSWQAPGDEWAASTSLVAASWAVAPWDTVAWDAAAPADLTQAESKTTFGLDGGRSPSGTALDLGIPASWSAETALVDGRQGTSAYRAWTASASAQATALNLFGTQGSQPRFSWYRTDAFSWSASGLWSSGTREADQKAEAALGTRSELKWAGDEGLTLPVSWKGSWGTSGSQALSASVTWSLSSPARLPFTLPGWLSPRAFPRTWAQETGLSTRWAWDGLDAWPLRDLEASWTGTLQLSEGSSFALKTRWGQQFREGLSVVGLDSEALLVLSF